MSEKSSPSRLSVAAGVVGLATAVLGLAGAAIAVFKHDDGTQAAASAPRAAIGSHGIDQSGLDGQVPSVIDGFMSGPAFVDLWAENRLCFDFNAEDESCLMLAKLIQRSRREIRALETFYVRLQEPVLENLQQIVLRDIAAQGRPRPVAYFRLDYTDYLITREGICMSTAYRAGDAASTEVTASSDGSFQDAAPLTGEGLAAYRAELANTYRNSAVGDHQCWRYKRVADDPNAVDQYYFIDGVAQPRETVRFRLVPLRSGAGLRLPG